jgi:pyruvate kinase
MEESRTKIMVTLGPASSTPEVISGLISAGADVFRLNFSHGTHESHERLLRTVREEAGKAGIHAAVLQDLSGTKIRLGDVAGGPIRIDPGDRVTLRARGTGDGSDTIEVGYERLPEEVRPGDTVLIGDGAVELEIESVEGADVACSVVVGGEIASGKGVAVPGRDLSVGALTDKDRKDLAFGLEIGVDMVALSFVRGPEDIGELRDLMGASGTGPPVIAKIERHECVENLEAVIDAADGVMVARGDLGVDVPIERVPVLQKRIVSLARAAACPVIVATQMLRSMVESRRPTRAEATDVANAVLDGADAIMLSEETSVGAHPVRAVRTMHRIAGEAEGILEFGLGPEGRGSSVADSISEGACRIALEVGAKAIVVPTFSGSSARKVARFRTPVPVIALSPREDTLRQLSLVWGVVSRSIQTFGSVEDAVETSRSIAREVCGTEGTVVLAAGLPLGEPGRTNLIKVLDLA